MSIQFITDSGSDIPQGTPGVHVIPLQVSFGEDTFEDGVTLDHQSFYEKLTSEKELPVTSQASPYAFSKVYKKVVEQGDTAIVVTLSSKLSGTYQSACIAAADYPDQIYVVDSLSVTVGQRTLIEYGMQLASDGLSAKEIVTKLEETRKHIHVIALLDTLEYLKKGGRISAATAFAGGLLSIKPVVTVIDGKAEILGKARGSKQGNNYLIKEIESCGGIDFSKPFYLGYTGNSRELLDRYIKDSEALYKDQVRELPVMTIGGAIGTHIGPGAIAVAFIAKE